MASESSTEVNNLDEKKSDKSLFLEFPWFYDNIYGRLQDITAEFFQKEYNLRFISVSYDENNILFFGDEYFVNKISVNKAASAVVRISSSLVSSILDNTLGASAVKFSLNTMTDIETRLMQSFTLFIYNKLEGLFIKTEPSAKTIKKSKIYNYTFYVQYKGCHSGKIIISVPDYIINGSIELEYREDCYDISCFSSTEVLVTIRAGSARIPLNDLKAIEEGDVIILDDSDVNRMELLCSGNTAGFNITPNPALIISVDKTGGSEMNDDSADKNSGSMWDTIMVDVTAEFDNFKMTLGELKQISEGLLVDIGSVYENKIKLRAAKQVIASGELVILNDRYGVRIDTIRNNGGAADESPQEDYDEEEKYIEEPEVKKNKKKAASKKKTADNMPEDAAAPEDSENFDYSDFEIEDESI